MIRQFIFAGPKSGLSPEAFQSYWVNFHAVEYASKIPQIKKYLVATRFHIEDAKEVPFFEGVAEIWLENEQQQIASLQTPEFLNGARLDEPRWAAFWQTFVHDAETFTIVDRKDSEANYVKLYVLLRRKPGQNLNEFRDWLKNKHAIQGKNIIGIQQYTIDLARDSLYSFGEPRFDAIEVYAFLNLEILKNAYCNTMEATKESWSAITDERYLFTMVAQENWVIRNEKN
jgi:hypothetical protein